MSTNTTPQPIGSRVVPPDPSITSAIGRHHTLATAVADLVDNSIDAGATDVLVRFLLEGARPVGLQVIDNGSGMDSAGIDAAMTYAKKREYEGRDLGHFGLGLKAASLSQARSLLVWSKRYGCPPVGRRLRRETIDTGPRVEEFSSTDAETRMKNADVDFLTENGTIIEWQDVQTFLTSSSENEQTAWVNRTTQELLDHLGLVFHRILDRGELSLSIENYDVLLRFAGAPRTVTAIDPFGYRGYERGDYPKSLPIAVGDIEGTLRLHVWPHRDKGRGLMQGERPTTESQGLYIYRKDRLLQAGGWNGLAIPSGELMYARAEFDLTVDLEGHVTINPEKDGARFDDELRNAFLKARSDDGTTLRSYRSDAQLEAKASRQRSAAPIEAPLPGDGLPDDVKDVFGYQTEPNDVFPIDIKWRLLPDDQVYKVDVDQHSLALNAKYREAIVGNRSLNIDDAPLVKSLLLLLLNDHFLGTGSGARKKREDAAWQAILLSAIRAQAPHAEGKWSDDDDTARPAESRHLGKVLQQRNHHDSPCE